MAQWKIVTLGMLLTESKVESSNPSVSKRIRVRLNTNGVDKRPLAIEKTGATKYYTRKAGQFIYGRQNLHKGAFGIVPKELDGFESSSDMPAFDVNDQCLPEWIELFLKQGNYYLELEKIASGVGSKRISPKRFLKLEIPLPTVNEQQQIVEKSLLQLDKQRSLKCELDNQKNLLKKLRQQILQDAIGGKLTKDWREQNPDVEPASELLKRIEAEKQQLIKDKKIKKQKALPEITDDEKPFELPNSWEWCRLGGISSYGQSVSIKPDKIKDECWVLELEDIEKSSSKLLKKINFMERRSKSGKSVFQKGDVLYGKLRPYLDKVIVADQDGVCTSEIMVIKLFGHSNPFYIRTVLKSEFFINYVNSQVSGMRMPRLKTESGRFAIIPLPPLNEHKEIVKKVEKLFAICDQLEEQITSSQTNAEQLMQSVLKEAFSQSDVA